MMSAKTAVSVIGSNLWLLLKRMTGTRIRSDVLGLIRWGTDIRTSGEKGKIILGRKCGVRRNVELAAIDGELKLGNKCFINRNCVLCAHESIVLEDGVTVGPGTYIYDHDHDGNGGYITKPVHIGKNVWIGAGCIILKGVAIGDNAVVWGGTLVAKDIPSDSVCFNERRTIVKE